MIKIRMEATTINRNELDTAEVCDSSLDSSSLIYDFFEVFKRVMLGMSFTEVQINDAIVSLADEIEFNNNSDVVYDEEDEI